MCADRQEPVQSLLCASLVGSSRSVSGHAALRTRIVSVGD